jgi:DNA-binding response OmpR family regulator
MEPKGRILIVDDEQINLDFFDVMLTKLGFEIEKAEDGEEALSAVMEVRPDLIILDNIMPKLTGWEVTKILKNDGEYEAVRDVPIIMFSAMDDVKDKIEGFELGIDDYITKPFNFSEVLARIQAVLRSRDLSQQVIQRERRLAVVESLNKSLLYFTEHLRNPVLELIKAAENLDSKDQASIEKFKKLVRDESEQTLAALDGLQDEIKDLREQGDEIKSQEISLADLEQKYQKRYQSWKEKEASLGNVKK